MTTYCDSCGNPYEPDETGSRCCPDCRINLPRDKPGLDEINIAELKTEDGAWLEEGTATDGSRVRNWRPLDRLHVALLHDLNIARRSRDAYREALFDNYSKLRAENEHFRRSLNNIAHPNVVPLLKGLHTLCLWLDKGASAPPDESYRSQGWESLEEEIPDWRAIFKELTGADPE
jgi:hypothetical protein